MPCYTFRCKICGNKVELIRPMSDSQRPQACFICGSVMNRDYRSDIPHASNRDYTTPIHSDALAINPNQRKEHQRLFPNIELDKQSRPVFSNYRDHQAYLDKCNAVKLPKKIRRRGRKISSRKLPTPVV